MKNEDILPIKKMIKYCDDIGTLMTKFDKIGRASCRERV